jgi:hypothetical protein
LTITNSEWREARKDGSVHVSTVRVDCGCCSAHPTPREVFSILDRNKALKKARTSRLCSFLCGAEDSSTLLPYQGYDVLQKVARSARRALVNLDRNEVLGL